MIFDTGELLYFIGNTLLLGVIVWQGRQIKGDRVASMGALDASVPKSPEVQAMRTYSGRPRSNMQFSTSAAMATSVF